MSDVKRYCLSGYHNVKYLAENENGGWVKYEDYEALRAELKKRPPAEPTEEMFSGLARDIMMGFDLGMDNGVELKEHLLMLHEKLPASFDNEVELHNPNKHVMSKATRAVLIYKAMVAEAQSSALIEKRGDE